MPKAFIKNIDQIVKEKLQELRLKPQKPLAYFKQKEKRFYAAACQSDTWARHKNQAIFFKMLISAEQRDALLLKKEAILTKFLYEQSRADKRLTFPKFIRKDTSNYPFWLMREYLPGKIIGYHFKIYQLGLNLSIRDKIVETVLALQDIDYHKISGICLEQKTWQDYENTLKKFENELKLWKQGQYYNQIDFRKIHNFFQNQKQYFNKNSLVLTHGDLTLANFFSSKSQVFLTDWEWTRIDNLAYDICRLWIQTFKYSNWRQALVQDFLKNLAQNKKNVFQQSFRLIAILEAITEFFGNLLQSPRKTKLKQSMLQTINLSLKGFNQLINQK